MKAYILPTLLLLAAIGLFFWYTNPTYQGLGGSGSTISSLEATAQQANTLSTLEQQIRDKYNALTSDEISKLNILLPDSIDTIRLIAELNAIGAKDGVTIQNLSINSSTQSVGGSSTAGQSTGAPISGVPTNYGILPFSFSVTMSYQNFLAFLGDLEHSLQLIDVQSIGVGGVTNKNTIYTYTISAQTYWLK